MSKNNKSNKSNKVNAEIVAALAANPTPVMDNVSSVEAQLLQDMVEDNMGVILQEGALPTVATVETTAIAATVAVKTVSAAKAAYLAVAAVHPLQRLIDSAGAGYAPKNKGAFMVALWYVCCEAVGYTNTSKANASLITLCSELGGFVVTHCASKGQPLAGAEISEKGATGYARALKGALQGATDQHSVRFAQYLQGGKKPDAYLAEIHLARLVLTLYGKEKGLDACKRAVGTVSV